MMNLKFRFRRRFIPRPVQKNPFEEFYFECSKQEIMKNFYEKYPKFKKRHKKMLESFKKSDPRARILIKILGMDMKGCEDEKKS